MRDVVIWGETIPGSLLTDENVSYIASLPVKLPSIVWLWSEMDRVWMDFGLNNRLPLSGQPIGDYYSHPVWLINGIFTKLDPESAHHRAAIASYLEKQRMRKIADYGGGFGELAIAIVNACKEARVTVVEPYPSSAGLERVKNESHITFESSLDAGGFDAVVAQDVLEHVEDPVYLAHQIATSVKQGGVVVYANCFYPVIKCHLPATFHLRHTFPLVMRAMGLRYQGTVDGAPHAQIFGRVGQLNLRRARFAEKISRILGPLLNKLHAMMSSLKRALVN